jgi:hypothetical protein
VTNKVQSEKNVNASKLPPTINNNRIARLQKENKEKPIDCDQLSSASQPTNAAFLWLGRNVRLAQIEASFHCRIDIWRVSSIIADHVAD